jgi:hypothetical protein
MFNFDMHSRKEFNIITINEPNLKKGLTNLENIDFFIWSMFREHFDFEKI